jgi:hypothetical protein
MVRVNLYDIFVLRETKVEQQEGNTLRDVKVFPLFPTTYKSIN